MTQENKLYTPRLIIEPNELKTDINTKKYVILHISNHNPYKTAHIPNALHVPAKDLFAKQDPVGKLPDIKDLEHLFGSLGYTGSEHFIVYDDEAGGWAGRFIWILDMIGHKGYSYLNGGLIAWIRENHPIEQKNNQAAFSPTNLTLNQQATADLIYIKNNLSTPNIVLWDARSKEEFLGIQRFAKQGGHIPGAIHFEWLSCLDPIRNYRIKIDIATQLANKGIKSNKEVICYCQTHHRSGLTYLVAKSQNFLNIKAYPGSWAEWGNSDITPITCEQQ